MGEKKTVYAVATGDYSDYAIEALFEDYGDAEETAQRIDGYVQEFDLYSPGGGQSIRPRHQVTSRSFVDLAGNVLDYTETWSTAVDSTEEPPLPRVQKTHYIPGDMQLVEITRRCDDDGNIITESKPLDKPRANFIHAGGYLVIASANDESTARELARKKAAKVAKTISRGGVPATER